VIDSGLWSGSAASFCAVMPVQHFADRAVAEIAAQELVAAGGGLGVRPITRP
jgi:hypothetical protein